MSIGIFADTPPIHRPSSMVSRDTASYSSRKKERNKQTKSINECYNAYNILIYSIYNYIRYYMSDRPADDHVLPVADSIVRIP